MTNILIRKYRDDIFIVNLDEKANMGYVVAWDNIGGHSEADVSYIRLSHNLKDKNLANEAKRKYETAYNIKCQIKQRLTYKQCQKIWEK